MFDLRGRLSMCTEVQGRMTSAKTLFPAFYRRRINSRKAHFQKSQQLIAFFQNGLEKEGASFLPVPFSQTFSSLLSASCSHLPLHCCFSDALALSRVCRRVNSLRDLRQLGSYANQLSKQRVYQLYSSTNRFDLYQQQKSCHMKLQGVYGEKLVQK